MKSKTPSAAIRSTVVIMLLSLAAPGRPADATSRPVTRSQILPSRDSLTLAFPGVKGPIPYESYGHWEGIGTADYHYVITDRAGLARAAGEGIYPNNDVYKDPAYQQLQREGRLRGNQWNFADTPDSAVSFYKWASAAEDPGVKQFYESLMLERLGDIAEAVKGFYAVAVHFPKTVSYTYFSTPWYVGPAALDRMEQLLRRHPELKMRWIPGGIKIQGKFGTRATAGPFIVDPGRLVADSKGDRWPTAALKKIPVVQTVGGTRVQLKKYANHHWQLFVDGKPFVIKGLTYSLTPIGLSPDRGTWNPSKDWQLVDTNHNGLHDGFFEAYIDRNGNGQRDPNEPIVGDAQLIKELGVNTLRTYHHVYNKDLFRRLYKEYGLYILCGDILGGYAVDSGATWAKGTDYSDPAQQDRMLASVRKMVEETKDEPYVLMWVIGNENIYGVGNNSPQNPAAFYALVDRAAQLVHELDPSRPVAIANGDLFHLDVIREKCPHIDVLGANVYRGEQGFGRSLFQDVQDQLDKPVLITEFGGPSIAEGYTPEQSEAYQAMYFGNNWDDLEAHRAGRGVGNAIGGVIFEYIDEWWKANSDLPLKVQQEKAAWYASRSATYKNLQPENHDSVPQFGGPYLDGWSYEEWFGITSQGDGKGSPFARTLRPAYFTLKELLNGK